MASNSAKRVASSAVDWARYAAVVPKNQVESLRIIKAKHDNFLNKVYSLPEKLPKIDFAAYKNKLPDPTMAERFQKAYEALSVPYPKDKDNLLQKLETENQESEKKIKEYVAQLQKNIAASQLFLDKLNSLPKYDEFSRDMYAYYFPDSAYQPGDKDYWPYRS